MRSFVVLVFSLSGCAAPHDETAREPVAAAADDGFAAVRRWIADLALEGGMATHVVEETDSAFARRFRELAQEKRELREFAFHGAAKPGHPAAGGAMRIDRLFLAVAGDAVPSDEWNFDEMVALARRLRLRLASIEDARWFLRADVGLPPIDVMPTHEERRVAFRIQYSGEAKVPKWNELELDEQGVPQRIVWKE
jgi:hypothetical protein